MKKNAKAVILLSVGLSVSVLPVTFASISYFPIWQSRGAGAVISGFSMLLLLLSAVPLWKLLKRIFSSPSAWMMWLIVFLLFYSLSKIANEVTVIAFTGFVSNIIGALFFKLSKKYKE